VPLRDFHPAVQRWFTATLGPPSEPQRRGWPLIREGRHTLIAAPTGSGKTLAAFLWALDRLIGSGSQLPDQTQVVYASPLRALSNDVQKNLQTPLAQLRQLDPSLPQVRVLVRSGDTPASARSAMRRLPPHILVTTPESLAILLTTEGGRDMLRPVRTVIVDEIHALVRDKRGAHLALALERLEALAGPVQRIGLSATQKPLHEIASFLAGCRRECACVDIGHRRRHDLALEVVPVPLAPVCSHDTWSVIDQRMAELIEAHRTTLVFVNTRRLAERLSARLAERLGAEAVACHHSSLSRERRLDAEQRLKAGTLRALVATASLELGIDIGEVDLVIQVGSCRSIATLLQRLGRSGHGPGRISKGRVFPLTQDELVEAAALVRAVNRGDLDRIVQPRCPLDILAQHVVAECAARTWEENELFECFRRAWPFRDLARDDFDRVAALHTAGRSGLLHRDGVGARLRGRRRARLTALTCGGAIPDNTEYRVVVEPEGTVVGTVDEDFAVESSAGDIFQLGNASWRVLKLERGLMRVADAQGLPPSVPFWFGEAPARTDELSFEVGRLRQECAGPEWAEAEVGLSSEAAAQLAEYLEQGRRVLGALPTTRRVIVERFFDESGGMQLVLHAPFGRRINRAWGLALRKRFCRGFGFELQAAATEEAIVIALGPHHSFPLEAVLDYLHPASARDVLVQALLDTPMFTARWRWNAMRSLVLERSQGGRRVPPPILRMRADDLLIAAFPAVLACPENLPPGDLPVPWEHPLVRQTIQDCLTEAMDVDGFLAVLEDLRSGRIERLAVDTPEPSALARGVLAAQPYSFLDDAPLEERRTQAVSQRRSLDPERADEVGALDPAAVERVRAEAWPQPQSAEEVHEALLWMGFVTDAEAPAWRPWLEELAAARRVTRGGDRWYAAEADRSPREVWRGRLQALGPVFSDDPVLQELEGEGFAMRLRLERRAAWCERRLLARIHRYTLEGLRRQIEPVTSAEYRRFLARWQHVEESCRLDSPAGVLEVVSQLAGWEAPAREWERSILAARVRGCRREWLDELALGGRIAWGRLWGSGKCPLKSAPISLLPRGELDAWLSLCPPPEDGGLCGPASDALEALRRRGALFHDDLLREARLVPAHLEMGLAELVARGLVTCDSFAALRQMMAPPSRRRAPLAPAGRWSLFRPAPAPTPPADATAQAEFAARALLRRSGVVFRLCVLRERLPVPWSALLRALRRLELRGEVRGGRFVAGHSGEQFALPHAVEALRATRRLDPAPPLAVSPADPLNLDGVLTPQPAVTRSRRAPVMVG
jgi:ATP-dependent Lhr-like helicase